MKLNPSYIFLFGVFIFILSSGFIWKVGILDFHPTVPKSSTLITDGLVAYYPMNGNGLDSLGLNNGNNQGLIPATDRFGNPGEALAIDQKTDYMTISPINSVDLTVSFWYYHQDPENDWNTLLCRNGGSYHHILINYSGAAKHEIGFWRQGWYPSGYKLTPGNWYFITLIKEGTRSRIYIGEDLIMDSQVSFSNASYPLGIIGNFTSNSGNQGALGKLDEIRIYDRALTEQEISILYDNGGDQHLDGSLLHTRPADLSVIAEGTQNVEAVFQNAGQSIINSGTINWSVDGLPQAVSSFSNENLTFLDSLVLNLGIYNFTPGQTYEIRAWLTAVNGGSDVNLSNDTTLAERIFVNPAEPHQAIEFNGVNEYIKIDDAIAREIAAGNEATFEFWFKAVPQGTNLLFSVNPNSTLDAQTILLAISNGKMGVFDGANGQFEILTPKRYDDEAYHHLAYSKIGNTGILYVDGNYIGEHPVNYTLQSDDKYSIGQEFDGINTPSQFFKGIIDEVRIWKIARTEEQIRDWISKNDNLNAQPGLVAVYHFGETVGREVLDMKGTYDGTLINEPGLVPSGAPVGDNRALNDAGITAIVLPDSLPGGNQAVEAVVYNFGQADLQQASVRWAVNGQLQPPYNWTGNLATNESDTIPIGTFDFQDVQAYQLEAWTTQPNGAPDFKPQNDSTTTEVIYSTLSGSYTVGGIDPDFKTLSDAVEALNIGGISNAVTFNIRSGIYEEQLLIEEFLGSSCDRPVIFQSETQDSSDVLLRFVGSSAQNYLFQVSGADGITFRHLSFEALNVSYSRIIDIRNGADCFQLISNYFSAPLSTSSTTNQTLLFTTENGQSNHQMQVNANTFKGGSFGIILQGNNSDRTRGTMISSNRFIDQARRSLHLRYHRNPLIKQNFVQATNNRTDYEAVYMNYVYDAFQINANFLSISKGGYGIFLDQCFGSASQFGLISNNSIWIGGGNAYAAGVHLRTTSAYINIYHNSIHINSTNASGTALYLYWYYLGQFVTHINVVNNNLANSGGGRVMQASNNDGPGFFFTDHNNLFNNGGNILIGINGTHATLADWQTSSGKDQNSVSVDPQFFGEQDLRVALPALDNTGAPLAEVTTDIFGQARNPTNPDIGAYEFGLLPNDVGILRVDNPTSLACGSGLSDFVRVQVINYSNEPKSGFSLGYQFGTTTVSETFTETIPSGQTALFTFDQPLTLPSLGSYTLDVFTQLAEDLRLENDTIRDYPFERLTTPGAVTNMIPANGVSGLDPPLTFSWAPASLAQYYDIYLWPAGQSRPNQPTASDLDRIRYTHYGELEYGTTYQWQVVSKNGCGAVDGPIQSLSLRALPDLIVESIEVPAGELFSGQTIEVQYTIRNIGSGSTPLSQWHESFYFSEDNVLQFQRSTDRYLGSSANPSILMPNESYSGQFTFTLPREEAGPHWIFIDTDRFHKVKEELEDNNFSELVIDITMVPNPDLVVSAVNKPIASSIFASGDNLIVEWELTNQGDSLITNSGWRDAAYLSTSQTLNKQTAIFLGSSPVQVDTLRPGATTIISDAFKLPDLLEGEFWVFIETDANDNIFEFTKEDNNISTPSTSVTIVQKAFADLVISDASSPSTASNKDTLTFSWEVTNQGAVVTSANRWYDQLAFSADDQLSGNDPAFSFRHNGQLDSDSVYTVERNIIIPDKITGPYRVFFTTDSRGNEFEFTNEANNTFLAPITLDIRSPDLTVSNLSVAGELISGNELTVNWSITNQGTGTLHRGRTTDRITLADDPADDSPLELAFISNTLVLAPGQSANFSKTVQLPDGIEGTKYIGIESDYFNRVYETEEGNNAAEVPIAVSLATYPDLQASLFPITDPVIAGSNLNLSYYISNLGGKDIGNKIRRDQVYIIDQPSANVEAATLLTTIAQNNDLAVGSNDTVAIQVTIPADLPAGTYYLFVRTNSDGNIYEHGTNQQNNTSAIQSLTVQPYPPVDLNLVDFELSFTTLSSGKPFTIQYTAGNLGAAATIRNSWTDGVYLSEDLIWSPLTDRKIGEIPHSGKLFPGDQYMGQQRLYFPDNLSGNFYLFLVIDNRKTVNDPDFTNNVQVYSAAVNPDEPVDLEVTFTPPPDLSIPQFEAPELAIAGQPLILAYTLENNGVGATDGRPWTDRFLLSADTKASTDDLVIYDRWRTNVLAPGASLADAFEVRIPMGANGNYFLIAQADATNAIYEHFGEGNNTAVRQLQIIQQPPADLVVSQLTVPDSIVAGQNLQLSWTTVNQGDEPATGKMTEAVYLSKDNQFDPSDLLLYQEEKQINLAPQDMISSSIHQRVEGVDADLYYTLVYTDVRNNIAEVEETNNVRSSDSFLEILVENLEIGVTKDTQLVDERFQYYQIFIPDSLAGETLLLSLQSDAGSAFNELYLRFGHMPDRVMHDFRQETPFLKDQEVLIPYLRAGVYFVMVVGDNQGVGAQPIHLTPSILPFAISDIDTNTGGNSGAVTVKITGSRFDPDIAVSLQKEGNSIVANSVDYVDPTTVYATFDLSGQATGWYHVVATSRGDLTQLEQAFSIETGQTGTELEWISVDVTRPNRIIPVTILLTNTGNIDIPAQDRLLLSERGAPIAPTIDRLVDEETILSVQFAETDGPAGILRPGASGKVIIYSKASSPLKFRLLQ